MIIFPDRYHPAHFKLSPVGEDNMTVNLSFLEEETAVSLFRHVETRAGAIAVVRVSRTTIRVSFYLS
jgi:hypothetical protein